MDRKTEDKFSEKEKETNTSEKMGNLLYQLEELIDLVSWAI